MRCPVCQSPIPEDARFCPSCAAPAPADAAEASVVPSPPAGPRDPLRQELERALGNRYEVVRLLGRGGMGAVYLARESVLDRVVAIKVLPPEVAAGVSSDNRKRFRREAQTAAKLTHPNIVPLHTFGETAGLLYFVMGYVRGESLADRLRHEGKIPIEDVRRILAELADALDYAHRRGVIHRDVKPDNILLEDESGRPMLTDFGIARAITPAGDAGGTLTSVGSVVGTPLYMSPEQASGEKNLDGRSDLYSLGAVGYAMVTGRPPFTGENAWAVLSQHATKAPAPLAEVPGVPTDLAAAIMKCLEKDPVQRWPDGKSLRGAVSELTIAPEDVDEGQPPTLRALRSLADWIPAVLLVAGQIILLQFYDGKRFSSAVADISIWLIGLLAVPLQLWAAARKYSWKQALRVFSWPPKWWPLSWPLPWRRPGDVWPRLPSAARRGRHAFLASTLLLLVSINLDRYTSSVRFTVDAATWPTALRVLTENAGTAVAAASVLGLGLTFFAALWWCGLHGLRDASDCLRMFFRESPNKASFWQRPEIARLLLPISSVAGTARATEPRMPHEYLRAISDLASQLAGPARALGSEAIAAARQATAAVAAQDKEIETLARDADPTELARLEHKLAALGSESPSDTEEQRKMRSLVADQLKLVRQLGLRLQEASRRRERLLELLRMLWLQLANLRAADAADTFQATEVTARVRAVCADIERYAGALAEITPAAQKHSSSGESK